MENGDYFRSNVSEIDLTGSKMFGGFRKICDLCGKKETK